jgi:hypothetical protein
MRSVFSAVFGGGGPSPARDAGGRPEALRRRTIADNARLVILVGALCLPAAFYFLMRGMVLPFAIDVLGLAVGFLTLGLHHRGRYEQAASGQVYGIILAGVLLALADPAIVDFGLATALLAPVLASLLTRTPVKKRSWLAMVVVVAFAAAASVGLIGWPEPNHPDYSVVAAIAFLVTALLVALTASRLNSAFEVYEKAQINAYRHLIEHVQDAVMRFSARARCCSPRAPRRSCLAATATNSRAPASSTACTSSTGRPISRPLPERMSTAVRAPSRCAFGGTMPARPRRSRSSSGSRWRSRP